MSEFTTENFSKEFFISGYKDYCKRVGNVPTSAYRLCKFLYAQEVDFSIHFDSIKDLQRIVWNDFLQTTLERLATSKEYDSYCARERLLAFYYTLFEELKPEHAFYKTTFQHLKLTLFTNHQVDILKAAFRLYINELIAMAKETEEISTRAVIENYYEQAFTLHFIFLLNFWSSDTSENFQDTDAAVEKSTNLLFDLLQRNAGDATADFAKFLFTHGFKLL
jgi:hypothetical protein